jgi:hypothetical protein
MPQAASEHKTETDQLRSTLEKHVDRISEEVRTLAYNGDWGPIKSVLRVLDAYARAKELRAQGQPARAHFWLVGVGRKRQPPQKGKPSQPPRPAA